MENNKTIIPQHEIDALARALLPDIIQFYESEEGQQEFEKWKSQQETEKISNSMKGGWRPINRMPSALFILLLCFPLIRVLVHLIFHQNKKKCTNK